MNYLLLDSSNSLLAVALKKNDKLIDKISYPCFQRQSEYMMVEIANLLKRNKISFKKIDGIMVTIGPGSYTGLRIALTIAKVAAFSLNIPLYPISTLKVNAIIKQDSIVLFNARSDRSYIAAFRKNKQILKDQVMNNNDVKTYIKNHPHFVLVGDLAYLNLKGRQVDVLQNMNQLLAEVKPVKDVNLVKPVYLKESYL